MRPSFKLNIYFVFDLGYVFQSILARVNFDHNFDFLSRKCHRLDLSFLGYLNETGEIVNLDLANERRSKIFTEEFYNSFDGRLNRFVKLYDFIMDNHE